MPAVQQQFSIKEILPAYRSGEITVEQATGLYEKFLNSPHHRPMALNMLGVLKMEQNQFVEAVGLISQAIALDPDRPGFHHNLATNLRVLGRFDDAVHYCFRALTLEPNYASVYLNLAEMKRFSADDAVIPLLEKQLANLDQKTDEEKCILHFAAGKIYQDLGDYPRAFEHFIKGNTARNAVFDPQIHDQWIQRLMDVCDRSLFDQQFGLVDSTASPIFIVGMPRSGTTLTESILTRHPSVTGLGELPDISSIAHSLPSHVQNMSYPECLRSVSKNVLDGFHWGYRQRLTDLAGQGKRTVDKMPTNFFHLGLLALLFPNAKIIHCHRHPLDTCLSCYCKRFYEGQDFSYDLENLGHYYLSYQRVMNHWSQVLPIPIFNLEYERLIQDQETVSRELLDFCALPWDATCLKFNANTRPVKTASNWQVRQPLYSSSIQRWKHYEQELAPLRKILNC